MCTIIGQKKNLKGACLLKSKCKVNSNLKDPVQKDYLYIVLARM